MNNKYPFYLTVEEYAEAINNAHIEYLKTMHRSLNGVSTHHIADLAISSTSFFESAYFVLDSISSAVLDKIRKQEAEIDKPLWHEPSNPKNKDKKRKK